MSFEPALLFLLPVLLTGIIVDERPQGLAALACCVLALRDAGRDTVEPTPHAGGAR